MRQDTRIKRVKTTSKPPKTLRGNSSEEWLKTLAHLIVDRIIEDQKNGIARESNNKHQASV